MIVLFLVLSAAVTMNIFWMQKEKDKIQQLHKQLQDKQYMIAKLSQQVQQQHADERNTHLHPTPDPPS